jgi:hypothetical protein
MVPSVTAPPTATSRRDNGEAFELSFVHELWRDQCCGWDTKISGDGNVCN